MLMGKLTISMAMFKFAHCLLTRPGIPMVLAQIQWIVIMFPSEKMRIWGYIYIIYIHAYHIVYIHIYCIQPPFYISQLSHYINYKYTLYVLIHNIHIRYI